MRKLKKSLKIFTKMLELIGARIHDGWMLGPDARHNDGWYQTRVLCFTIQNRQMAMQVSWPYSGDLMLRKPYVLLIDQKSGDLSGWCWFFAAHGHVELINGDSLHSLRIDDISRQDAKDAVKILSDQLKRNTGVKNPHLIADAI